MELNFTYRIYVGSRLAYTTSNLKIAKITAKRLARTYHKTTIVANEITLKTYY